LKEKTTMIRYRIARFLLVLGMVFGFGSGIASVAWHAHHGGCHGGGAAWGQHDAYREQLTAEFADACVAAARRATPAPAPTPAVAPQAAPAAPTVIPMPFAVPFPQYAPAPTTVVVPSAPAPAAAPAAAPSGT
jgi:hypothetical protein